MSNIKKLDFFNVITGDPVSEESYGRDAQTFKKVDNVDMIFDSRGEYLGIRTCRGKFINDKYTAKEGIRDFKSFLDLGIWASKQCPKVDFIETRDGTSIQIRP